MKKYNLRIYYRIFVKKKKSKFSKIVPKIRQYDLLFYEKWFFILSLGTKTGGFTIVFLPITLCNPILWGRKNFYKIGGGRDLTKRP